MKKQCTLSFFSIMMVFRHPEEGPSGLLVSMAVPEAFRAANSSIFVVDFIIILYSHHQLVLFQARNDQSLHLALKLHHFHTFAPRMRYRGHSMSYRPVGRVGRDALIPTSSWVIKNGKAF